MMEPLSIEEIQQRIERLDDQIAHLNLNMKLYRRDSDPWLRIYKAKQQLEANLEGLKAMLKARTGAAT